MSGNVKEGAGFTLIELLVVLAIVASLLSIVAPRYMNQADRAREAVLKEDLAGLRMAIDQFQSDKGAYPTALEQLVEQRYLRKIPVDPITNKSSTWVVVTTDVDGQVAIVDIKSGAQGLARDGTAYQSW